MARKTSKITLDVVFIILGISAFILAYLGFQYFFSPVRIRYFAPPIPPQPYSFDTRPDLDDPYNPPLVYPETQVETQTQMQMQPIHVQPQIHPPIHVVPINVRTNGMPTEYRQVGILTRNSGPHSGDKLILSLMGRSLQNGRDKWQYYTMSNSPGAAQTRLPISVNGRSCTSEYGCDSISNGDVVYVEGYNETFRATLYETGLFSYLMA
jgi:hypothetical protein